MLKQLIISGSENRSPNINLIIQLEPTLRRATMLLIGNQKK